MKNIIYYEHIDLIGGVSTFTFELVKKYYKTKDITLYYKTGDVKQIARLKEYIKVVCWNGEDVECDNFITNYNFESFIPHVKLSGKGHTYQVIHAMYKTNRVQPKVDDFFDYYVCVSEIVKKEYQELTNLPNEKFIVSHNPLTITKEEAKPSLVIGVFQRLRYAWEKGEKRIDAIIKRLDALNINYLMLVASDSKPFTSKNVVYIEPRIDGLRNIMAICDVVMVLSDCEGDNYTSKEAKCVGCKVLATPIESLIENKVIDKALEFDLSNINECIDWLKDISDNKVSKHISYEPIQDKYEDILLNGISNYERETKMKIKLLVQAYDVENAVMMPKDSIMEVSNERGLKAISNGYAVEVKEEVKEVKTAIVEEKQVKKAIRKTTKK